MLKHFFQHPVVNFVGRTVFYLLIILSLLYLYGYSGVGEGHFLYNEF
ncbi:teichoic acid D-Ala incorporation-associated protein DltX [Leuconostoc suionicum]